MSILILCIVVALVLVMLKDSKSNTIKAMSKEAESRNREIIDLISGAKELKDLAYLKNSVLKLYMINRKVFPDYHDRNVKIHNAYCKKACELISQYQSPFEPQKLLKAFTLN